MSKKAAGGASPRLRAITEEKATQMAEALEGSAGQEVVPGGHATVRAECRSERREV